MKNLFGKIKRRRPKLSIGMWLLFSFVIITFAVLWLLRGVLFQEPIALQFQLQASKFLATIGLRMAAAIDRLSKQMHFRSI